MAVFAAKYASPIANLRLACPPVVARAAANPLSLFVSPPGFLDLAELAAVIDRQASWIWLDELDRDPISLLRTILSAARLRSGSDRPDDLGRLARHADRPESWPNLYRDYGEELADLLAPGGLVLVDAQHLDREPGLRLLTEALLPRLTARAPVVLVSGRDADIDLVGNDVTVVDAAALRLDERRARQVAAELETPFTMATVQRAALLTKGRRATFISVLVAGALMGPDLFEPAVMRADDLKSVLIELIRLSLTNARPETLQMLALVARLGLTHPRLVKATLGTELTAKGPWLMPLEFEWARVDPLWRLALTVTLASEQWLTSEDICRLADQLIVEGAPELAIPLFREAGNSPALARSVGLLASDLAASGRWGALGEWARLLTTAPTPGDPELAAVAPVARRARREGIWSRWHRLRRERAGAAPGRASAPASTSAQAADFRESTTAPSLPVHVATPVSDSGHQIEARLLGRFNLIVNGQPVERWHGTRCRSVLKYLLAHDGRPIPRDVLMDTFWRDAGHAAARNSLNVAHSNLRRTLRPFLGDVAAIVHEAGAYRLNPDLDVDPHVEEFERRAERGLQLHSEGELPEAARELERAASLYRGPYQEDEPYAETAILTRERLRVIFLDVLDRLGDIAFARGHYDECIAFAQSMLAHDRCREDAHRRIMRCCSRQGQTDLALRRYQACVTALHDELDVTPSPATVELHEAIRRHQMV
jgi:DNA-binding SARP family transcriptional activator